MEYSLLQYQVAGFSVVAQPLVLFTALLLFAPSFEFSDYPALFISILQNFFFFIHIHINSLICGLFLVAYCKYVPDFE